MQQVAKDRNYYYKEVRPNDFYFETKHNNVYNVRFVEYWQNDILPLYTGKDIVVYEVYFEIVELKKQTSDIRVAFTASKIVDSFLRQGDRVVFFTAVREDGRTEALAKVYDAWFNRFNVFFGQERGSEQYYCCRRYVYNPGDDENIYFAGIVNNLTLFKNNEEIEKTIDNALYELFPCSTIRKAQTF